MANAPTTALESSNQSLLRDDSRASSASMTLVATLAIVMFLTMLPVTMMVPVLRELVGQRFEASAFWSHSFMSINMIGAVLAAPFGGVIADRVGRRKPLLIAALALDGALVFAMSQATSLSMLMTFRFVEGAAHILAVTTIMAIAADWVDAPHRGRMMGVIGASLMFGTSFGSPLGGRVGQHDPVVVFYLGAGFSFLSAFVVLFMVQDAPMRNRLARWRDALPMLKKHRELFVPYAYAFIDRFCVGVMVSSFVLYLSDVCALSPSRRGMLIAMMMLPFALLCYPIGRLTDRFGRVWPMCVGSLAFGVVYASYGFIPISWLPAAMVLSGVLSAIMFAPNLAMCSDLAPDEMRAGAYAGFNMAGSLGFLCGPLIGGIVWSLSASVSGDVVAYKTAFLVAGGTEVLCALLSLPWLLRLRRAGLTR